MDTTGWGVAEMVLKKADGHLELKQSPAMGAVFLTAFLHSFLKPSGSLTEKGFSDMEIRLKGLRFDKKRIALFKKVCGYPENGSTLPLLYPQLLFLGLMGRLVTNVRFPLNPMGLIHTGQTVVQYRALAPDEILDLTCRLTGARASDKGIEMDCFLGATAGNALVWEGITTFLSRRSQVGKKPKKTPMAESRLPVREIIPVPENTGRCYAAVSGDYNPLHLSRSLARLLGFKHPIAHGMWSLARCLAGIEKTIAVDGPVRVEASFKRPIFMPATVCLGYETIPDSQKRGRVVVFELRDEPEGIPHVVGIVGEL